MQLNIFLNAPGTTIKAHMRPTGGFVVINSGLSDGRQALCIHTMIDGTPEQLLALADEIYREFEESKLQKYLPQPQPSADDEAAEDFERLQQARANTPEANMELPERKTA